MWRRPRRGMRHFLLVDGEPARGSAAQFHIASGLGGRTNMGKLSGEGGERDDAREEGSQGCTEWGRGAQNRAALGGRKTSKHRGNISEMQFMIEASNRGFGVAKPIGDNERYDVILDRGCRKI